MHDINILSLFGIEISTLEKYEIVDTDCNSISFLIKTRKRDVPCPKCGMISSKIKDYKNKRYVFKSPSGKDVIILYKQRRYKCDSCGLSFLETNPFIRNKNYKISSQKILEVINYLKDSIPITLVAKYSYISVSSVNRILDKFVKVKRRTLPSVVSIDEFCSFNSDYQSKYSCLLLDYDRGIVLDVIESRRTPFLDRYFSNIKFEELKNVKYVVMDMYRPYKDVFHKYCPNVIIIIDPFHYIRYVTDAMERIRVKVMKKFLNEDIEYKLLKKYRKLLLTKEDVSYYKPIKVSFLGGQELYPDDIKEELLKIDDDLRTAYYLSHDFLTNIDKHNYKSFHEFLGTTIQKFLNSNLSEFISVGETYSNWRAEIENSKLKIDDVGFVSNGKIEGFNNKIKTLKKISYGLHNFEHLRKRIFLIFDKSNPTK